MTELGLDPVTLKLDPTALIVLPLCVNLLYVEIGTFLVSFFYIIG